MAALARVWEKRPWHGLVNALGKSSLRITILEPVGDTWRGDLEKTWSRLYPAPFEVAGSNIAKCGK